MIVQCTTCRILVDVASVQIVDGGVNLHCSACNKDCFLPTTSTSTTTSTTTSTSTRATAPQKSVEPWKPSREDSSPSLTSALDKSKSLDPQVETSVSASVPPSFDKVKVLEAVDRLPLLADPSGVASEFLALLDHWNDADAHAKLIQRAALQSALPVLGARYRAVLEVDVENVRAKAAQDQIMTQAMARMGSFGSVQNKSSNTKVWSTAAMVLLALIMSGAIWYMVLAMKNL